MKNIILATLLLIAILLPLGCASVFQMRTSELPLQHRMVSDFD